MSNINYIIESVLKFDCKKMKNCKDLKIVEKLLAKNGIHVDKAHDIKTNERYWDIRNSDKVKHV